MEVKRMYVDQQARGRGIASIVLCEHERWSKELDFLYCILEKGVRHHAAVNLYRKNNYYLVENFGQYTNAEETICFKKQLD